MSWLSTIFVLAAAFVAVFLEASLGLFRNLLGAQIDLLPALMVYAALTHGFTTIVLLAVCGGLWFDSLSLNPLGASVLPLLLIGLLIYRSRELLMREHVYAQAVLGVAGRGGATAGDAFHFAQQRGDAVAGLDLALAMAGDGGRLRRGHAGLLQILRPFAPGFGVSARDCKAASGRTGKSKEGADSMFVFDIFKEDGRRLQVITGVVAAGMLTLLGGLWFVQIVCAKQFERTSRDNAIRHVRTPAFAEEFLTATTNVLAEERPLYNAVLYLEDLQPQFGEKYARLRKEYIRAHPETVNAKGKIKLTNGVPQLLRGRPNAPSSATSLTASARL
jgi:rod shape-determining protein MreD